MCICTGVHGDWLNHCVSLCFIFIVCPFLGLYVFLGGALVECYMPRKVGSQRLTAGMKVTISNVTASGTRNGRVPRITS